MRKVIFTFSLFLFPFYFALAAISLAGVTGEKIRARAFFDANNVKVGDPLILTVDFLGTADFKALHPPALSRAVDRKEWKVDDTSAKTQTESRQVGNFFSSREIDVARRLTYRVRPMREGVIWFPALEFEYETPSGEKRTVRANEIPVHAKPGADIVVTEMGEDERTLPQPDALVRDAGVGLTDDESFAWRRACANPTADGFAAFDFPAAKLNEARCAILGGNWARAMKIYQRLEWRTGQTPEIERGIVAALALRYQNPAAELPVWRQVGRPLLRYGWRGRVGWVGGGLVACVLVFWLLGKAIRVLACVAVLAAVGGMTALPARAEDPFAAMEKMMQRQRQQMQQMMSGSFGGGSFSFGFGGEEREPPKVTARLALSNPSPRVGERFDFIVSLEVPKSCTVEPSNFSASNGFGLTFVTGRGEALTDGKASNTNNVVKRIAIPARYDVPFKGDISFSVSGMVTGRQTGGRRGFSFSFSNSFEAKTPNVPIEVRPLENPPEGFAGIVATGLRFEEAADTLRVETNDIIRIVYRMNLNGWLPEDWMPEGAAFECGRNSDRNGALTAEWQRYFVADGAATTPKAKVVYYDPKAKKYKTVTAGGTRISYER